MRVFARLRRPLTITASAAVVVAMTLPLEAQQPKVVLRSTVLPAPKSVTAFKPARLVVPKLRVDAPVVEVLTLEDGTMGSPTNATDVGWWPGRKVGQGNVLLDSHHDWNGAEGSFYRLEEMRPGDHIVILGEKPDQKLEYVVVWNKQVNGGIDATDILGKHEGKQEATLITCGGAFDTSTGHHVDRIVVRAELVWG